MSFNLIESLKKFYTKGNQRSIRAKKNITASFFIKGVDVAIGFLLVPLVLTYLDQTRYGIWLTMTSLVSWFTFMNIGLGHGLKNKFAEARAKGNHEEARKYVSTTYAIISFIVASFFLLFIIVNFFLPWSSILNVDNEVSTDLSILALIVFGSFCLKLVLDIISYLIVACQMPAVRDTIRTIGRLFVLLAIFILTKTTRGSLIYLSLAYTLLPILALFIASFYFFSTKLKKYKPSIKFVDFHYSKDLIGLGGKFFIIQIALMVIMNTDNIIITQLFGPAEVTPYQIAHKYFNLLFMVFMIFMSPVWSASIEAFAKKEFSWIKNMVQKLNMLFLFFALAGIFMLIISPWFYKIWVGEDVHIPLLLSGFWLAFVVVQMYNAIYFHVINGSGKIKLQMYTFIVAMILNIPLSILFAKTFKLGPSGVILATVFCQLLHILYLPLQYKKIIKNEASGIWAE